MYDIVQVTWWRPQSNERKSDGVAETEGPTLPRVLAYKSDEAQTEGSSFLHVPAEKYDVPSSITRPSLPETTRVIPRGTLRSGIKLRPLKDDNAIDERSRDIIQRIKDAGTPSVLIEVYVIGSNFLELESDC